MPETTDIREQAHRLIDALPEDATWTDLALLVYERQRIEEGIRDLDEGRTWTTEQVREKFGLPR